MSLTESRMLPLGTEAPAFSLPEPGKEREVSWNDLLSFNGTVVMFICNHCPYVIHVAEGIQSLANDYQPKGVGFVAINSNDVVKYTADSPEKMVEFTEEYGFTFPYLFDESQEVAKAYDAACTPDFYLFDENQKLVYRGQMDGSRPGSGNPVTGVDLRKALDQMLAGDDIPENQRPSAGCNIKWKPA